MSKQKLKKLTDELSKQNLIYVTEKDLIKANNANWEMTKLIIQIQKENEILNSGRNN